MRVRALLIWVTVVSPHSEICLTHITHTIKPLLNESFSLILHPDMSSAILPSTTIFPVLMDKRHQMLVDSNVAIGSPKTICTKFGNKPVKNHRHVLK